MIRSNLCAYSDAYLHFKGILTLPNTAGAGTAVNNTNKKVIFKNCAALVNDILHLVNCISEINYTQLDDAQHID